MPSVPKTSQPFAPAEAPRLTAALHALWAVAVTSPSLAPTAPAIARLADAIGAAGRTGDPILPVALADRKLLETAFTQPMRARERDVQRVYSLFSTEESVVWRTEERTPVWMAEADVLAIHTAWVRGLQQQPAAWAEFEPLRARLRVAPPLALTLEAPVHHVSDAARACVAALAKAPGAPNALTLLGMRCDLAQVQPSVPRAAASPTDRAAPAVTRGA